MALTTQLIGVNTVLGAFVAGILIGESPILTATSKSSFAGSSRRCSCGVLRPVRLSADITILRHGDLALLAVGLILIASIGKFSGAFIAASLAG